MKSRFHITKRLDLNKKQKIVIRCITLLSAFLLCGLICNIFSPGSFGGFFETLLTGPFTSTKQVVFLLEEFALLLGISLALLPAFKMRFWNLGAEGQVLLGGFAAGVISKFVGPHVPNGICIVLMILGAFIAGGLFSFIPAIFRARFGTNETLFTLMLNYIAIGIVSFFIQMWDPSHGLMNGLTHGMLPMIFNQRYIVTIISVIVIFVLIILYMTKSKHGYELSVVGENANTARYIGINDKKVIIRTAILSGAICGLIGFFIVGYSNSVSANLADGRGFTSVLIVWLGHFNPFEIALYSFLLAFLTKGASNAQTFYDLGSSFPAVCIGVFFLVILVGEFFLNYKIVRSKEAKMEKGEVTNG